MRVYVCLSMADGRVRCDVTFPRCQLVSQDRTRVKMMHSAAVAVAECVDVRCMLGDRQTDRWTHDRCIDPAPVTLLLLLLLNAWMSDTCSGTDRQTDRWTPDRFIDPAPVTLLLLLNAWMSDTCSGTDRQTDRQMDRHPIIS